MRSTPPKLTRDNPLAYLDGLSRAGCLEGAIEARGGGWLRGGLMPAYAGVVC